MIFGRFWDHFLLYPTGNRTAILPSRLAQKRNKNQKRLIILVRKTKVFFSRRFVHVVCFIFYMDAHVYTNILVNLVMYIVSSIICDRKPHWRSTSLDICTCFLLDIVLQDMHLWLIFIMQLNSSSLLSRCYLSCAQKMPLNTGLKNAVSMH